jgi:hypothetical protein
MKNETPIICSAYLCEEEIMCNYKDKPYCIKHITLLLKNRDPSEDHIKES